MVQDGRMMEMTDEEQELVGLGVSVVTAKDHE